MIVKESKCERHRVVVFNKRSVQRIVIFHRVFEAKVYVVKLILKKNFLKGELQTMHTTLEGFLFT